MFATILEIVKKLLSLIQELRPTAFEKKEEAKKEADDQQQKFWDDRSL